MCVCVSVSVCVCACVCACTHVRASVRVQVVFLSMWRHMSVCIISAFTYVLHTFYIRLIKTHAFDKAFDHMRLIKTHEGVYGGYE